MGDDERDGRDHWFRADLIVLLIVLAVVDFAVLLLLGDFFTVHRLPSAYVRIQGCLQGG
jgi:hypothetical protein